MKIGTIYPFDYYRKQAFSLCRTIRWDWENLSDYAKRFLVGSGIAFMAFVWVLFVFILHWYTGGSAIVDWLVTAQFLLMSLCSLVPWNTDWAIVLSSFVNVGTMIVLSGGSTVIGISFVVGFMESLLTIISVWLGICTASDM